MFLPPERFNLADWLLDERIREGRGGRVALRLPDRSLTYEDVRARANRIAHALVRLGLRPEERVFVALPDGVELVATLFAILKTGGVAVLVNPDLGAEAIASLLDYCTPRLAVVHADVLPSFAAAARAASRRPDLVAVGAFVLGYSSLEEEASASSDEFENARTHRDDPAIWLFSGGTTGRPKAVVQTHRSYANTTVLYGQRTLGLNEDDVTCAVPKLYFGYAMGSNLFFPFSVGASACLFPEKASADSVFAAIRRHRPTILVNVPTMIQQMVGHPEASRRDWSCLRLATSAGEALPVALHEKWKATFGVELLDGLGTAEQWHIFLTNRPGRVRPGTLGEVVDGFEIRVVDDGGADLPPGEPGKLWVRGGSRAIGYWREMDKTMDTFRGEWVATGDLVSRDADGFFTYHGRSDDVVKVSGKWFSPAEVESCLARHSAVAECAVLCAANAEGLVKPYAFVVARATHDGLGAELREFVARELSPYKAPREIRFVDDFPRTHLGKIDRATLRAMI